MSVSKKVAAVFGATGYTGREVVRQLRERGVRTIAHIRPDSKADWGDAFKEWGAEVEVFPLEPDAIRRAFENARPDVVFALIGTTRARARREDIHAPDIYDEVDYRLTAMLIDALAAVQPSARFVYLSSGGADPTSFNRYLAARGRTEERLTSSGLPYTIARPSFITGPGRDRFRKSEWAAARAADLLLGTARRLGAEGLWNRYRSIDNVALARGLLAAAFDPACGGKVLSAAEIQDLAASR